MAYYQIGYLLVFLPLVILLYQIVPAKFRWVVLTTVSMLYFLKASRLLVLYFVVAVFVCWLGGIQLQRLADRCKAEEASLERKERKHLRVVYQKKKKKILVASIVILIGILAFLKYQGFVVENSNQIAGLLGLDRRWSVMKLAAPLGISFYTLEAVGYMADVYWGKITAQKNPAKLVLFLAFFPQLMEGPIAAYSDTSAQLFAGNPIQRDDFYRGFIRILWGLSKKMVIADRLAVPVKQIFNYYQDYNGPLIAAGAVFYTLQLYMEFSGCIDIVIGSAQIFGVKLPENFRQPFFSENASEFWRRWHISLGTWFKTYIFYPVSVSGLMKRWNQYGKKHLNRYLTMVGTSAIALFPVWLCNGIWHGADWNYLFYGMYYFVMILLGIITDPLRIWILKKFDIPEHALWYRILRILKTWVIIFTGELFFRANGLKAGMEMFGSFFHGWSDHPLIQGALLNLGLDIADYIVIFAGILLVFVVDLAKERGIDLLQKFSCSRFVVKASVSYVLLFMTLIFGAYGYYYAGVEMIYANF